MAGNQRRLFGVRRGVLLAAADVAACTGSIFAALYSRFGAGVPWEHALAYLACWPLLALWRLLMAYQAGLYDFRHRLTIPDHLFGAVGGAALGVMPGYFVLALVQLYYLPGIRLSRLVVLFDFCLLAIWFAVSRTLVIASLHKMGYRVRMLLVGPAEACRSLAAEIADYAHPLVTVAGIIALEDGATGDDIIGKPGDLPRVEAEEHIGQMILVQANLSQEDLCAVLAPCETSAAELFLYPALDLSILANTKVMSVSGLPLVPMGAAPISPGYRVGKRLLDIALSLFLLILLSPFCLLAAFAIRLTSPGPALFSQERIGRDGRPFMLRKLRTMVVGAEDESGPVLSAKGDPRVTAVGRWLRKLRLDEAPQLWNVLCGHMSLVGPRPERREFIDRFVRENPLYQRRLLVKPGLTGLAQVHGRYDTDYTHKLRYDLIYINRICLNQDLRILFATVRTVITGRGAI